MATDQQHGSESSTEATLVGYLMDAGWELHLVSDITGGVLVKITLTGEVTRVETCKVSPDAVIDLHQAGKLQKKKTFFIRNTKTTVFVKA